MYFDWETDTVKIYQRAKIIKILTIDETVKGMLRYLSGKSLITKGFPEKVTISSEMLNFLN